MGHKSTEQMKRNILIIFLLLTLFRLDIDARVTTELMQDSVKKEKKWSLGYMGAFYYDQQGFLLFPLGFMAEYKLNDTRSIDIQGINYYFGKTEAKSTFIYIYNKKNFTQIDIGYNIFFKGKKRPNEGAYIRPSIGTLLYYEYSIMHFLDENLGIEREVLKPKGFVGLQLGVRNRFAERLYYRLSGGANFTIFSDEETVNIFSGNVLLISPYIALGIGFTF